MTWWPALHCRIPADWHAAKAASKQDSTNVGSRPQAAGYRLTHSAPGRPHQARKSA
jgi:hypothetical protein